jgi:ribonuclease G
MTELRVACSPGEARIAAFDGDTLLDFALWRPGKPDGFGDLHAVRVTAPMEAMGGAFVTLADGTQGFLTGRHREGALVAARVTRSAQGGKGLRLKPAEADLPDAPSLLRRGPTPLESLAAAWPDAPILIDSPAFAALAPAALRPRVTLCLAAFDEAARARCDALAEPEANLPGGVIARFTPTPALVAIDLDNPGRDQRPTAQVAANLAALPALCRDIRLRNLGGAILIDPAGVTPRKRQALLLPLREALKGDPAEPQALGVTALGLLELVRTRGRPPLHELLASPHGIGLAALRHLLTERPASGASPLSLAASIPVIRALEEDRVALEQFADAYGTPLQLAFAPDYPLSYWSSRP